MDLLPLPLLPSLSHSSLSHSSLSHSLNPPPPSLSLLPQSWLQTWEAVSVFFILLHNIEIYIPIHIVHCINVSLYLICKIVGFKIYLDFYTYITISRCISNHHTVCCCENNVVWDQSTATLMFISGILTPNWCHKGMCTCKKIDPIFLVKNMKITYW